MPKAKPLSKELVLAAMNKTKSNKAAARYLNVSYIHYKKWARLYDSNEEGYSNLFEQHKNQCGKGIPKFLSNGNPRKDFALLDLIEGRIDPSSFNPAKIKYRLIQEGYLKEECTSCGFYERRVLDYKMPLILNFKDNNKQHYRLENLEMLCYNCYFLQIGDIFTGKQLEGLEDHVSKNESKVDWDVDDYTQQRLKELGLFDSHPVDDGSEFISRL
jgi:5-methylcytosine-specific restriction endonuclease McrA